MRARARTYVCVCVCVAEQSSAFQDCPTRCYVTVPDLMPILLCSSPTIFLLLSIRKGLCVKGWNGVSVPLALCSLCFLACLLYFCV